jgi:hypothetical protein
LDWSITFLLGVGLTDLGDLGRLLGEDSQINHDIALAFVLASTAVNALPDFDNYTQFPSVSFESLCVDGTSPGDG